MIKNFGVINQRYPHLMFSQSWPDFGKTALSRLKCKHFAGRMDHVVECLLSKYETLSSNPSSEKKKIKFLGILPLLLLRPRIIPHFSLLSN
jgi:hypothetical protein